MTLIKQEDVIQSVADALQFISYYHPLDFIRAMRGAWGALKVSERSLNPMLYSTLDCSFPKKHPFFIVLSTGSTRPVGHKGGAEGPASSSSATAVQHIPRNDHMEDFS